MTDTAAWDAAVIGIRRLSGLGLPGHEVVPQMLRRLHGAIGSATNTFEWVDPSGRRIDYYSEPPYVPEVAHLASEALASAAESAVGSTPRVVAPGMRVVRPPCRAAPRGAGAARRSG